MASQEALNLADELLQDFRGAGYYADPEILIGRLSSSTRGIVIQQPDVIELFRFLLRNYASGQDLSKEDLARYLDNKLHLSTP